MPAILLALAMVTPRWPRPHGLCTQLLFPGIWVLACHLIRVVLMGTPIKDPPATVPSCHCCPSLWDVPMPSGRASAPTSVTDYVVQRGG